MKKHTTGKVRLTGSQKKVSRTIYTDGEKYFIKWYGNMIEVINVYGYGNITEGWKTVEAY